MTEASARSRAPASRLVVVVMVAVVTPPMMMMMVGDVVAHDRPANAADHGADRPRDHCSADRASDRTANGALLGRLGRPGEAKGQHRAASHDESTHVVSLLISVRPNELGNSTRRAELGSGLA